MMLGRLVFNCAVLNQPYWVYRGKPGPRDPYPAFTQGHSPTVRGTFLI